MPRCVISSLTLPFVSLFLYVCKAKNRDSGREEGLIPLFLGFLKKPPSPIYQKQASYIVQSLSYNGICPLPLLIRIHNFKYTDANKDVIRDANGIDAIVSVLDQQKLTNQEISMNCINSLLLLLSNRMYHFLLFT
jgi:hypothetical protein